MSSKRKRVLLNIEEKLKICEAVKNGVPKKIIMNKYELGKSTLNDILRNENKLLTFVNEKKSLAFLLRLKKQKGYARATMTSSTPPCTSGLGNSVSVDAL